MSMALDELAKQTEQFQGRDNITMIPSVKEAIAETGAGGLKDMGTVMSALRARYPGRMDFAKASAQAKAQLG